MGQDSSQIEGESHDPDGVTIKIDPDENEKENERLGEVSNWKSIAAQEGSLGNAAKKVLGRRKKKGRKRPSSSSSKAAFEIAEERLDTQASREARDSPNFPQLTEETAQISGFDETPPSASRAHKLATIEAKKQKLLAVVAAAASDVQISSSDGEVNEQAEIELNETDQRGADGTNQVLKPEHFAKPARRTKKSSLVPKRATTSKTNGHWTPEASQVTRSTSIGRTVKDQQSILRLASASIVTDEEDEPDIGLQLPTPNKSSQVRGRQSSEDQFTSYNASNNRLSEKTNEIHSSNRDSATRQSQENSSVKNFNRDEAISDEDPLGDSSTRYEPHSAQNSILVDHSAPALDSPFYATFGRRVPRSQAMDFFEPALENIGADLTQQPQQIGVYKDLVTSPTTRKRKRRLPVDEDDHEDVPQSEPKTKRLRKYSLKPKTPKANNRKSTTRKSREVSPDLDASSRRTRKRVANEKRAVTNEAMIKGKFSQEELDIIQNEMTKYKEMTGISTFDVNQIIQDTPGKLAALWDDMCIALPNRSRVAIIKVSRRKFHNFESRGKWTQEEDRELKEACERYPKRWKEIGQLLNRHFEDCRDRWRNYIVCGDTMKKEHWTEEEEHNLRIVVDECIQAIRELKAAEIARNPRMIRDARPDIELIDWQIVSEKLGRTRSRLQCLEKWNRMSIQEDSEGDSKGLKLGRNSWRVKSAAKDIKQMRREDYLELLTALRNSHAGREGKVNWSKLGDSDLKVKWSCMARKVAWKKLRASVPNNEHMKFQDIVTLLLHNPPASDADLEGADNGPPFGSETPFEKGVHSPQKHSSGQAISSAYVDEYQNIDPELSKLGDGDFDPDDIQELHSSSSASHENHNFNRDMLQEAIGESYFDSDNMNDEAQGGDMAMVDRESVDLDQPSQQNVAKRRTSRLGSPISFNLAPNQKQTQYDSNSTHSDEENVDMDIPARRPKGDSRHESVDLDID